MKTNLNPSETQGIYQVTERAYERSNTAVQFFDFPAKGGITVGYVLGEITRQRWHRYNMTDGGVGCRWWMQVSPEYTCWIVTNLKIGQPYRHARTRPILS